MNNSKILPYHQRELDKRLSKLFDAIRSRAQNQLEYNFSTNLPKGILQTEGEAVENAIQTGIVGGLAGQHCRFSCSKTIQLAFDLLEDSNCHTEGAALMKAAKEMGFQEK